MKAYEKLKEKRAELAAKIQTRRDRLAEIRATRAALEEEIAAVLLTGSEAELAKIRGQNGKLEGEEVQLSEEIRILEANGAAALEPFALEIMAEIPAAFAEIKARYIPAIEDARKAFLDYLAARKRAEEIGDESRKVSAIQGAARDANKNVKTVYAFSFVDLDAMEKEERNKWKS